MESSPQTATPFQVLETLLRDASAPLPAKSLQATLGLKAKQWKALLADAAGKGVAKLWPKGRYWHLSPEEATLSRIPAVAQALQASPAPLSETELASKTGLSPTDLKPVLKSASSHNQIVKWPKSRYWHVSEADAVRLHLLAILKSGSVVANRLEQVAPPYSSPKVTAKILKEMLAAGTVVLAYSLPPADLTAQLLEAIRRLQQGPGIPVSVRDIRAAVDASKHDFDRAALELADRQQIYLTTHDHGWALAQAEQDILIHDGGSKLYVAVTLRD